MGSGLNPRELWRSVRGLNGKVVTTMQGARFRVTKVTADEVWWDPEKTGHPGSHWAERDVVLLLSGAILSGGFSAPARMADVRELCSRLKVTGYEQVPSYLFGLLSAIGVISHPIAGRVSDG